MRSLTGSAIAAIASPSLGVAGLLYLGFSTPIALNTTNWNLLWGGVTYVGAGSIGSIGAVDDSPGELKGLQLTLSGVSASQIALALDSGGVWQGTPVILRTAIFDSSFVVVDAPIEWTGRGDVFAISEDGETCVINASAESTGVDLLRGSAVTYSNPDQLSLFPGDRGLEYVVDQSDRPIVWPNKEFFYK